MKSGTSILVFCVAISGSPVLGQTLPDIARHQGGSAGRIIDIDSPVTRPAELMLLSDLVIHGRVVNATVRLNSEQSEVVTEYTIAPIQAFKDRRFTSASTPGAVPTILVQRGGGSLVTADGLRLSTDINIFPESECFKLGEEVVLFLTYHPDTNVYSFAAGAFAAFRIRDGMVRPMTQEVATRLRTQPFDASAFFKELQRLR